MFKIGLVEFDFGHNENGATYGDQTVYQVEVAPGTLAAANAMRWQLQGQKGSVVGVTWDDDPFIDGIYIQQDCAVSPISNYLATGRMAATVVLQRAPDVIETSYYHFKRADLTPSTMDVFGVHATNGTDLSETYTSDNNGFIMSNKVFVGEPDGATKRLIRGTKSFAAGWTSVQQACVPSLLEFGRARIEVSDPDGAFGWWTLTGTKVPDGHDIRISNGLERATVEVDSQFVLHETYDSGTSSWLEMTKTKYDWVDAASDNKFVRRFKVVRNERAEVVVRCAMSLVDQQEAFVELSVGRGQEVLKSVFRSGFSGIEGIIRVLMREVADNSASTTIAATNGLARSAAIGGITPKLFSDSTGVTVSTASSHLTKASSAFLLCGVGAENVNQFACEVQSFDRLVY